MLIYSSIAFPRSIFQASVIVTNVSTNGFINRILAPACFHFKYSKLRSGMKVHLV